MNIVFAGVGSLGKHLASILVKEGHRVILIDSDPKILKEIATTTHNINTYEGSVTDWKLLEELLEHSPDLFIALTNNDSTNLAACAIAKNLQYPRTIAQVSDAQYLQSSKLDFSRLFEVDHFICPELFVAHDIAKYISYPQALAVENFANGALQLCTLIVPVEWVGENKPLKELKLPPQIIIGIIRRPVAHPQHEQLTQKETIFPHGNDKIMSGDEVTCIGASNTISELFDFFKIPQKKISSVVIVGGSSTALYLAKLLQDLRLDVRIIEKEYQRCLFLAEQLPSCTVIHHDATDLEFLTGEKVGRADLLITCTNKDELNLFVALLGRLIGCRESHLLLNNSAYIPIASWLGFKYMASPTTIASNELLAQLFSGKITSLISLYENQAEIMEIKVSEHSRVVGIPLSELGPLLPKNLLILMIQNRGNIMIATGNKVISPGDTVILVTDPKYIDQLEQIF